jgi:3D (Asp-Asp-Asp) domain-containing protein
MRIISASPRAVRSFIGLAALAFCTLLFVIIPACRIADTPSGEPYFKDNNPELFKVTGYCNCRKCCSWEYKWIWFGESVYSSGKMKGKPKKVGITASGKKAKHGTVATDPKVFPFGTILDIPGYGTATVEDIGGAIKGRHIDIWFPSHKEAKKWGVKKLKIKVLSKPQNSKQQKKKMEKKNEHSKK